MFTVPYRDYEDVEAFVGEMIGHHGEGLRIDEDEGTVIRDFDENRFLEVQGDEASGSGAAVYLDRRREELIRQTVDPYRYLLEQQRSADRL